MWSGVMFKEQEKISFFIAHLVSGPEDYYIITRQNYPGDYCIIITKVWPYVFLVPFQSRLFTVIFQKHKFNYISSSYIGFKYICKIPVFKYCLMVRHTDTLSSQPLFNQWWRWDDLRSFDSITAVALRRSHRNHCHKHSQWIWNHISK